MMALQIAQNVKAQAGWIADVAILCSSCNFTVASTVLKIVGSHFFFRKLRGEVVKNHDKIFECTKGSIDQNPSLVVFCVRTRYDEQADGSSLVVEAFRKVGKMASCASSMTALWSRRGSAKPSLRSEILTKHQLFWKLCIRWDPKNLRSKHQINRMGTTLTFLQRYYDEGNEDFNRFVVGDEKILSGHHFSTVEDM